MKDVGNVTIDSVFIHHSVSNPVQSLDARIKRKPLATTMRFAPMSAKTAIYMLASPKIAIDAVSHHRNKPVAVAACCFVAWVVAWLLTLHPSAAGRTYAAYGGVYIAVALAWLRIVNGVALTRWDIGGACVALIGMSIIAMQPAT